MPPIRGSRSWPASEALDLVESLAQRRSRRSARIQDYGKFLYEKDKSERAARKKQKVIVDQGGEVLGDRGRARWFLMVTSAR